MPKREFRSPLRALEKSHLAWTNSPLSCIGTASSPFCSFYASHVQQRASDTKISGLVD